jgi:hypothetical protein
MSTYKIGLVTHSLETSQRAAWVQMFSRTPPTRHYLSLAYAPSTVLTIDGIRVASCRESPTAVRKSSRALMG